MIIISDNQSLDYVHSIYLLNGHCREKHPRGEEPAGPYGRLHPVREGFHAVLHQTQTPFRSDLRHGMHLIKPFTQRLFIRIDLNQFHVKDFKER